ncbi:MAG: HEAT repeat domain-containing protein [Acidobacteria bacterium]|nr:HEAT repeat domain-containing protein [Acidobacteriota bacterium]
MSKSQIFLLFGFVAMALAVASAAQRPPLSETDIIDVATLVKLEDTRQFDEAQLSRLLQSSHPEVRRRAVVTVGRIVTERGSELLTPLQGDADPEIVASVAFAYGQLRNPATIAWLGERLASTSTPNAVAFEAARALGKIRTPEARAALATYLANAQANAASAPVVGEALLSLGRYTTHEDIAPIVKWATSANVEIRWRAAWALFRPRNPAAIPALLTLSQDASPEVRFWAVRGLAPALVDEAKADGIDRVVTSARLRAAVKDTDRRVRTEALRALAAYDDDESFEVVLAALDDPDTWMSVSAAESMARFKDRIGAVAPKLAAAAGASRPLALRVAALTPLTQLAPPLALDAADALMRDPNLWVRTSVTQALRRMGALGEQKLAQLAADPAMKDLVPTPGAGRGGGQAAAAVASPVRTDADYRAIVERWSVPAYNGAPAPHAIWMTPKGEIELELHPGEAPLGMEELVRLTEAGSIVGPIFSRVVPNFVAQQATIPGANRLRDEVSRLGLTRANLAWASSGLDTGRPGYTLGNTPQPHNEGDFTALGRVVRGMDVVDRLELGDSITAARIVR